MSEEAGLCRGCCRSLEEIASWTGYSNEQKLEVLSEVEQRRGLFPKRP